MKTAITSRSALVASLVLSPAVPLVSLVSLNALDLSAVVSGIAAMGILAFAWADYQRKPRFRLPTAPKPADSAVQTAPPAGEVWTYQTISA